MFGKLKQSKITQLLLIILIAWIILAIIFGFTDLEISKAVVDETSSWGHFGRVYGEAPGYGVIAVAIATLIGSYNQDIKKQKIPAYIIIIIGFLLLVFGIIFSSEDLVLDGGAIVICLVILIIATFNKDWTNYRNLSAIITILAIINPLLFVQITKVLCGRVRFEDLAPGFTDYTPWFLPPGPSSDGRSFPSGHTAMGWMFLPLLIPLRKWPWRSPIRIIGTILIFGWGIFVGLSRIVVGAHYASDVLFSTMIPAIIVILLFKHYYLKNT